MTQADTKSYNAPKGGITALTHAMAVTLAGKAQVNSIFPDWIGTTGSQADGFIDHKQNKQFDSLHIMIIIH
jgi:NAD(P)-dependent dehydrogenase (short-subunit alcohol dehydrogenase family)